MFRRILYFSVLCFLILSGCTKTAVDSSKAHDIEAKLKERVEHKRKSAESYLTENLPIIDAAIVRCDGNTVSMLITENIDAANSVYEKFYK